MEYDFRKIEQDWQKKWKENKVYKVSNDSAKPKYYVLDMFPYPSGAGLHVGHPLGYIASDIYSRYKRLKGFNVLHPMGFDSFGLPAEQYALETGQHPAATTEKNIATFKAQLDKIGFCYDWELEVRTSDPIFYKWTQWIFLQLYNSYFCNTQQKARPVSGLVKKYETKGNKNFTAEQWNAFSKKEQEDVLMNRRLAFSAFGEVNWCEALGTVLANDEVVNGVSERGGHPVEKKKMRQWFLRISNYADRLLDGLETVDFSDSMKEMQKNWIGKSEGAEMVFPLSISPHRGEENEKSKAKMPGFGYADYRVDSAMSFENAKKMRREPTEAEKILWDALRNRNIGYKFRRQHPIENYIVDFVCLDVWMIVEVDGGYHNQADQKELDKKRDNELNEIGFTTLRITNKEVTNNIDAVLKLIKDKADEVKQSSVEKRTNAGGASPLEGEAGVRVYTTRPDTIFGVDFMVLSPEHELVSQITSAAQQVAIDEYLSYVKSRSERERLAEAKTITGCFTGAYAVNPFDGREIPIWIAEYVLAGYGTGAIMAVPCGDQRDFAFAKHFNIPITNIIGSHYNGEEANPTKDAVLENSGFLNGLLMKDAIGVAINKIEELGIGKKKVNYRMRDAGFSRQRYWGEPFPIIWSDGIPLPLDAAELPLELPHVDKYGPGPSGEGPLANLKEWIATPYGRRETSTMPGYAGSSWYFLRYMDPHNSETFCDRKASDYWNQVDLYIGGTEHAVGHLLYSRMWTKVLFDLGLIGFDEPYKKLLNQGMIQGSSRLVYRANISRFGYTDYTNNFDENVVWKKQLFISKKYFETFSEPSTKKMIQDYFLQNVNNISIDNFVLGEPTPIHVNVNYVEGIELDMEAFRKWKLEYANAEFILENDKYICGTEIEKMSKRYFNTVDPVDLCDKYGADTFRMYEMFLGPVEASKPWDTKGIEGVHRFLRKLWRLFFDEQKGAIWTTATAPSPSERAGGEATEAELKVLHRTIKKIEEDTERFSFNTAVSTFMICVNELADLKCHKKEILEKMLILLTPYAPHIAEELWSQLGNAGNILDATYPTFSPALLVESTKEYPVSINGKLRTNIELALDLEQKQVEELVLQNEIVQKWLDGKPPKKIIFVKGKMVNVVL